MSTADTAGRALVAMDDPVQTVFIEAVLNDIGYDVVVMDNADRAAELASRGDKYDVVLFDVTLPRLEESGLLIVCTDRWMRLLALAPETSGGVGFPAGVLVHGMLVAPYNSEDLAQFVDEVGTMRAGQHPSYGANPSVRVGPMRRWSPTAERETQPSDMGFGRGSSPLLKPIDLPPMPDEVPADQPTPAPTPAPAPTSAPAPAHATTPATPEDIAPAPTAAAKGPAWRPSTQLDLSLARFTTMDLTSPKEAMRGTWRASFDALQAATVVMIRLSPLMTEQERHDMVERARNLHDLLHTALAGPKA